MGVKKDLCPLSELPSHYVLSFPVWMFCCLQAALCWLGVATYTYPILAALFSDLTCLKVEFVFLSSMDTSLDQCRIPDSLLSPRIMEKIFLLFSEIFNISENVFNTGRVFPLKGIFSVLMRSYGIFSFSLFLEFKHLINTCLDLCLFSMFLPDILVFFAL